MSSELPRNTPEQVRLDDQATARKAIGAGSLGVFPSSFVDMTGVSITGGTVSLNQGTSRDRIRVGGMLRFLPNVTPVGNVGAGEDDLMTYTIKGGTFAADGDTIGISGIFKLTAAATIKAYFNGSQITNYSIAASGTYPLQKSRFDLVRLSSTSILVMGYGDNWAGQISTGLTLTNDIAVKFTGQSTAGGPADNDIVQEVMLGWYWPAN